MKKPAKKKAKKRVFTCEEEDFVIHAGKKVWVSCIVSAGREDRKVKARVDKKTGKKIPAHIAPGYKSDISVCRVMPDNGQILTRSPRHIGTDWEHI